MLYTRGGEIMKAFCPPPRMQIHKLVSKRQPGDVERPSQAA